LIARTRRRTAKKHGQSEHAAFVGTTNFSIPATADGLAGVVKGQRWMLVTGGTGFVGRHLVAALTAQGHGVIVLSRNRARARQVFPDHRVRVIASLDEIAGNEPIDAIINLAGEPIGDRPWTRRRRLRLLLSRLRTTRRLIGLIARLDHRPDVLISGSAVGWYGAWDETALTESSPAHDGFSHTLCEAWEREARKAEGFGIRTVLLRTGLVLDRGGGMLARMVPAFRLGLGASLGNGLQFMSWIHRDDLVRLIAHAITDPALVGPLNATAPNPATNRQFSKALAKAVHRPLWFRAPAGLLRVLMGDMAQELLLTGQRVLPQAALTSNFLSGTATSAKPYSEASDPFPHAFPFNQRSKPRSRMAVELDDPEGQLTIRKRA
jgi:uncharacterized protein (TIGR01777 family)